jgi:putative flippase GtrA
MFERLIAAFSRQTRFATVGLLNTLLDVGLFWMLTTLAGLPLIAANTMSYSAGVVNSFLWNKYWTFGDIRQGDPIHRQFLSFVIISIAALGISATLVWLFVQILPAMAAKLVSTAGTMIWNYVMSAVFIYRGIHNK